MEENTLLDKLNDFKDGLIFKINHLDHYQPREIYNLILMFIVVFLYAMVGISNTINPTASPIELFFNVLSLSIFIIFIASAMFLFVIPLLSLAILFIVSYVYKQAVSFAYWVRYGDDRPAINDHRIIALRNGINNTIDFFEGVCSVDRKLANYIDKNIRVFNEDELK